MGTLFNDSAMTQIDNHFMWDELTSYHSATGSTGKALTDAGGAGNPWASLVVDNTDAGTFGEALGKQPKIVDSSGYIIKS